MGAAGVTMDAINQVDEYLQKQVPGIYQFAQSEIPSVNQIIITRGGKTYGVDMSGMRSKFTENVDKVYDGLTGKVSPESLGKILDYADKAFTREGFYDLTGVHIQEVSSKKMNLDTFMSVIHEMDTRSDYGHLLGKVLQYNSGSTKITDTEHAHIPDRFNLQDSVDFMRRYGDTLKYQGFVNNNVEQVRLGHNLSSMAEYVQFPEMRRPADRDKVFTAADVQSVFNTMGERYPELMGSMKDFNMTLEAYENSKLANRGVGLMNDIERFSIQNNEKGKQSAFLDGNMEMGASPLRNHLPEIIRQLPDSRKEKWRRDRIRDEVIEIIIEAGEREANRQKTPKQDKGDEHGDKPAQTQQMRIC